MVGKVHYRLIFFKNRHIYFIPRYRISSIDLDKCMDSHSIKVQQRQKK